MRRRQRYQLDEMIGIMVLLEEGQDIEEIENLAGRSRAGLRSKFKLVDQPPVENGRTSCRSIKQYNTIQDLYAAFGEVCPDNDEDLQKDIERRYMRWKLKMIRGL